MQITQAPGTMPWLVQITRILLAPGGCPWDREQTLQTLRPFLIEEAYEVLDAIDTGDVENHCEELGDVLYQVVFHAELGGFSVEQVITAIGEKLIRRHPHVFGDENVKDSDEVITRWEALKRKEKGSNVSALQGIPQALPSLQRTFQLTRKAGKIGFRFCSAADAKRKAMEELAEVDQAVDSGDADNLHHEIGDFLFAVANWARELGIEPEQALRDANQRFQKRFSTMETSVKAAGQRLEDLPLDDLLAQWDATAG